MTQFELFIALRYLRAKRKQAVISVITLISVLGVAAGVMALVIALAITTGFRTTLQKNLLGVSAHVNVMEKTQDGIANWRELSEQFRKLPHVVGASPVLSAVVLVTGAQRSQAISLLGIDARSGITVSETLRHLKQGSLDSLNSSDKIPGIILGYRLAQELGLTVNRVIKVISPQGDVTPFGVRPKSLDFRVVGIFESGFFDFDANFAFASLPVAQKALSLDDVVNTIEVRLDDPNMAPEVAKAAEAAAGPKYGAVTWMEQNKQLFGALAMERIVTIVTIGLIELVAALNILIALVMMVMEKYRDIAVLISLGAKRSQIRGIFMLQGVLIGVVGTALGLILGYSICYFADRYHWIRLNEEVYALSYVPFAPSPWHGVWIGGAAILVSFLATIYPARNATTIAPAEVLRYE